MARTENNLRLYTKAQIREFIGLKQPISKPTRLVAYCRVPSVAQKIVLVNQREVLEEFVVANVELVPQKLDEALRKDKNATDS